MKTEGLGALALSRTRIPVKSGCCPTCWFKFGRAIPVFTHEKCPFCGQHHGPIAALPTFDPMALIDPDELVVPNA